MLNKFIRSQLLSRKQQIETIGELGKKTKDFGRSTRQTLKSDRLLSSRQDRLQTLNFGKSTWFYRQIDFARRTFSFRLPYDKCIRSTLNAHKNLNLTKCCCFLNSRCFNGKQALFGYTQHL